MFNYCFITARILLISFFCCLFIGGETFAAKNKKTGFHIVLDEEKEKENFFVFEIFTFTSGYDYQAEIEDLPMVLSPLGDSVGLSVINHFGVGLGFGLEFKNIVNWYHSGHLVFEFSGTSFNFRENMTSLLVFRNYNLGYKHRFHFLTKVNYFLPFVGASTSMVFQTSSIDDLINSSGETYKIDLRFLFSMEVGIFYKNFSTWFDLNYGKISNNLGLAYYVGFRL